MKKGYAQSERPVHILFFRAFQAWGMGSYEYSRGVIQKKRTMLK